MNSTVLISVANVLATVLTSLAVANAWPNLSPLFSGAAGLLVGWVNLHKPKPPVQK